MLGQSLVIYKKTPIYKKSEPAVVVTDNIDTTDLASKVAQGEDVSDQDADTEVETETEVAVASVTPGTVKQTVMVNKYHVVKKGESLGLIANKYNTSVPNIKTYNKLAKNTVYPGQKLIVGKKAVVKEIKSPVKETTDGLVHVVKQGESISGLALKYGCTSNEIREWNSLKSSALSVGQKLNIRTNPESKLKEADYVYHKIQQGDTLWSIAQKYGSSVDEIKKINNIANSNELHPGEVLKVTK